MSASIDERVAWELVRALSPLSAEGAAEAAPGSAEGAGGAAPGAPEAAAPSRVRAASGAWIDVAGDGSWTASAETTPAARDLLDLYLPVRLPRDLVIGQLGQSLDGRIATEGGSSHYVTGPKDIERLHRLRALVDAVIVGAGTVELDDPRLTVRLVEGPSPARVVLDPSGRLDGTRRVFAKDAVRTIVVRREGAAEGAASADPATRAEAAGAARPAETAPYEELAVPATGGDELDLEALLRALRARGLRRLLVEGGGVTVSGFLRAGLLDRLHLTVAPILIGSGRPSITLEPIESLDRALRPACRRFTLGEDVLFDLDLRRSSA